MPTFGFAKRLNLCPLAITLIFFAGCGGHDNSVSPTPTTAASKINGNFNLSVMSPAHPGASFVGGPLQTDTSGHVSGIFHALGALTCFDLIDDLQFSRTIDFTSHLTGTITSPNTQTMSIDGRVSADGTISDGVYNTSATGCFAGDRGTFTGFQMQPFTGTYTGTFPYTPGISVALTIPLTQPATPDAHGFFEFPPTAVTLTGGGACAMPSANLSPIASRASGGTVTAFLISSDGLTTAVLAAFTTTGSTSNLNALLIFNSGPCATQPSFSTLSRP
jgi:hypothetical protein